MAPQLIGTKGPPLHGAAQCSARTMASLPAPLSPMMISAFAWLSAIRSTLSKSGTSGECGA